MNKREARLILFHLAFCLSGFAQDTLRLTLREADSLFIKNSYYLLASDMNIQATKAQVIQAKVYPNPIVTAEINAYDPQNDKAFHIDKTGEKAFQIEQLILIGGKRRSEIEMAKTDVAIAELEFRRLVQNLRYQLHTQLFALGQQASLLRKYNDQLELLDSMLVAYQVQVQKGNIALKELVRLKGAYLQLNNDRAELLSEYYGSQSTIQKLLQVNANIRFVFSDSDMNRYVKPISVDELQSSAISNQPDLNIVQQNNLQAQQNLRYQKRSAVPDVNLFTNYDQRGGAFVNQINAGISLPLPLWNRNQGNIKAANFRLKESEYQVQAKQNELSSTVRNAHAFYLQTVAEYSKANELYNQDFETTVAGMTENFQKRNVSIIEFIDFFEAYNNVLTELTRIRTQLISSAEELNLLAGKELY